MTTLPWLNPKDKITPRVWLALIFTPLAIAIVFLSVRLNDSISTVHQQHRAITAQRESQEQQNRVLTELCRTNQIIEGLVKGTEQLFKYQIGILPPPAPGSIRDKGPNPSAGKPLVNPALVPYYFNALKVFIGWDVVLEQQTACQKVTKP